ncbi:MAG TPA: hypothetical protein VMN36_19805, partial [Verrucomicrobiales bacterium]|nr:hypothetical protein [Verrucomicrobiales bacterium]
SCLRTRVRASSMRMSAVPPVYRFRWLSLLLLVLAAAAGFVAASGDSLWMDEFFTVHFAEAAGLNGFFRRLISWPWSEAQMPLYLLSVWAWCQAWGTSEWALRLFNIPWFVLGAAGLLYWFRDTPRLAAAAVVVLCLSPFAWYYLDEARPYAPLLGASCWMLGLPLAALGRSPHAPGTISPRDLGLFLSASFVACALHLLAVPWFGAALLSLTVLLRSGSLCLPPPRRTIWLAVLFAVPFALLAGYYLHTLAQGSRARISPSNPLLNAGFSIYELFGFAGLGPNRFDLRTWGFAAFGSTLLPVACLAAALALLALIWIRQDRHSFTRRRVFAALLLSAPPFLFLVLLNVMQDFRFLGRHLTPALVVVVVWLACAFRSALFSFAGKIASSSSLLLLAVSCLTLRFHPRHANEDYQGAAEVARAALRNGDHLWWLAAPKALDYYGLRDLVPESNYAEDLTSPLQTSPGGVLRTGFDVTLLLNPEFAPADLPDLMLISRPSDYDPAGIVRTFLTQSGYHVAKRLHIFEVYKAPED